MRFLGHIVSASGVLVDPEKVEAVMSWERPKSVFEIRNFLGLLGTTGSLLRLLPTNGTYDKIDPEGGQV